MRVMFSKCVFATSSRFPDTKVLFGIQFSSAAPWCLIDAPILFNFLAGDTLGHLHLSRKKASFMDNRVLLLVQVFWLLREKKYEKKWGIKRSECYEEKQGGLVKTFVCVLVCSGLREDYLDCGRPWYHLRFCWLLWLWWRNRRNTHTDTRIVIMRITRLKSNLCHVWKQLFVNVIFLEELFLQNGSEKTPY